MTNQYLQNERLEKLVKSEAKKMRFCGFKATAKTDWANGIFGVTVKGVSDEDYNGLLDYQKTGVLSSEILILR